MMKAVKTQAKYGKYIYLHFNFLCVIINHGNPFGRFPEWPKGADCKSVSFAFGGSNPPPPIKLCATRCIYLQRVFFLFEACDILVNIAEELFL